VTERHPPVELTESGELLWRNVHPSFVDGGQLSSQAFRPTPKDAGRLSTAREDAVSAADHFTEYTVDLGLASGGVWAVSVGEVVAAELTAWFDAESDQAPDPCPTGHTSVDFGDASEGRVRKIGGQLRDHAVKRGRQHP
jgi:hypothetical protein